ncbi:MAG: hypothetical protein GWO41_12420 [candidate division Zixibacteria bacterium]|nr:hypothetical protein [candidate division Zixibacteria bacterium]NIR66072.1 hypothetical protein [candidate division Zixibacteria bacterium]NIS17156.1 hypothetical protein [candidate division Zixibacteria bacterium]NIS47702.1 hypothetical protein [candidate division Zixibacteria bacterium]NIT53511.1 hypothetical protein [candidate division Zixibacteria bacterium]
MYYLGDDAILKGEKAVILNSRQSKTPVGSDPWIQNSYKAVEDAISRGCAIVTSIGMNTWEFLVWAAGHLGGKQVIVAPLDEKEDQEETRRDIIEDFELDKAKTGFMFFKCKKRGLRGKSAWSERDKIVVSLANQIYPVCLREEGNLEILLRNNPAKFSDATLRFNINQNSTPRKTKVEVSRDELSEEIRKFKWKHLTHYTRSTYMPWPGESSAKFYRAIFESNNEYPRSALQTLKRIVDVKKVWSSYYHIRGGHKVVSFTELSPPDAVSLIKWRPRYVRWNFEPYGIAIEKDYARRIGIKPVIYDQPDKYYELSDKEKPFYQNPGEKGGDWEPEREWRHFGSLDLSQVPSEKVILLVRNRPDIFDSPYKIVPFTELS